MKIFEREQMIWRKGPTTGKAENIRLLLSDLGPHPDNIRVQIDSEQDSVVLNGWLRLAAKAQSVAEFSWEIT